MWPESATPYPFGEDLNVAFQKNLDSLSKLKSYLRKERTEGIATDPPIIETRYAQSNYAVLSGSRTVSGYTIRTTATCATPGSAATAEANPGGSPPAVHARIVSRGNAGRAIDPPPGDGEGKGLHRLPLRAEGHRQLARLHPAIGAGLEPHLRALGSAHLAAGAG